MRRHTRRFALLGLLLVLALPATGIGQGKTKDIPATVEFRNADGDKITADNDVGGKPISANIWATGTLFVSDNDDTGHRIHINFDTQTLPAPSPFNCGAWGATKPTWQMALADDLSMPKTIQLETLIQFAYDDTHGWAPVMNLPTKKGSATAHILDLRNDVPPGKKRYATVMIRLFVNSTNDMYEIWMNREWPTVSGYGYGIFEIEAASTNAPAPGAAGDTFTIRPLAAGQPYPLQGLGQNEALLYMVDYSEGGTDTSGPCNMGNFLMPFEMTVTRK